MTGRDTEEKLAVVSCGLRSYHGGIGHKWTQSHDKIGTTSDKHTQTSQGPDLNIIS